MKLLLISTMVLQLFAQQEGGFNRLRIIPTPDNGRTGTVDLQAKDGNHSIALTAPDTLTSSIVFRLPGTDPGGCVQTNGDLTHQMKFGVCGGANSLLVDDQHPLYIYSHFLDNDVNHIYLSFSNDGLNFKPIRKGGSVTTSESRDPSIRVLADSSSPTGYHFYFVCSPTATAPHHVQIYESYDLIAFTGPVLLDMTTVVTGATNVFAPEWITPDAQTASGLAFGFDAHISTDNTATFAPYYITYNVTTHAMTATAVSISATSQSKTFDPYTFYDRDVLAADGSTIRVGTHKYWKQFVDEYVPTTCDSGAGGRCFYQGISLASATNYLGPYTTVTTVKNSSNSHNGTGAAGPYGNWDLFGFSATSEAPSTFVMPNGCIRTTADTWLDLFAEANNTNNPRHYLLQYRDACPASGANPFTNFQGTTAAPVTPINIAQAEHGTILPVVDQKVANIVFQAAEHFRNEIGFSGHTVFGNTGQPAFYPMMLSYDSASGFIQNNQPPEFAIGGKDIGDASGNTYGSLGACGLDPSSCTAPIGGKRKLIVSYQRLDGGQMMFNNTNIDTGETSLLFGNGLYNYFGAPGSASNYGKKSLWSEGINNQCFGPKAACGNVANHWFTVYNAGLGPLNTSLYPNLLSNGGFETGSLAGWGSSSGALKETTIFHSGTAAAQASGAGAIYMSITGLTPNRAYTFSAWCASDVSATKTCSLLAYDGTNTETSPTYTPGLVWQFLSVNHIADSSGTISVNLVSSSGSGNIYFDDAVLADYGSNIGAFPFGISPATGEVRANYGLTLGQGDSTALLSASSGSFDAFGSGLLNIGNGVLGSHNAFVRTGSVEVGGDATDAYFIGPMGSEFITLNSTTSGYLNIGTSFPTSRDAFVNTGSVNVLGDSTHGFFIGTVGAESISLSALSANVLNCGDGDPNNYNCIFRAGVLDAQTVYRLNGSDIMTGSGGSAKWTIGTDTTAQVQAGTLVSLGTSYASTFQGTNANVTNVTATGTVRANSSFNFNGSGGVNTPITCNLTTTTISGTTITYCSSIASHTFSGGIKTN